MFELLNDLLSIDQYAMISVVSLSALGGFVMKQFVDSRMLVLLFVPAFLFGGLLAQFAFNHFDITLAPDRSENAVAVSAIGMMVALLVMMLLTRAFCAIGSASGPQSD